MLYIMSTTIFYDKFISKMFYVKRREDLQREIQYNNRKNLVSGFSEIFLEWYKNVWFH